MSSFSHFHFKLWDSRWQRLYYYRQKDYNSLKMNCLIWHLFFFLVDFTWTIGLSINQLHSYLITIGQILYCAPFFTWLEKRHNLREKTKKYEFILLHIQLTCPGINQFNILLFFLYIYFYFFMWFNILLFTKEQMNHQCSSGNFFFFFFGVRNGDLIYL